MNSVALATEMTLRMIRDFKYFEYFRTSEQFLLTHSYEFSMFYGFQDQNVLVQNSTNVKPDEGET